MVRHSSQVDGYPSARQGDLLLALMRLKAKKPLVVSMGDVAGSGGYYVACGADTIFADETTITGSIGVVAARLSLEPLLARLGVVTETIRRGAHAGLLSPGLPLTEDERAALSRELDATYKGFVGIVARGRKMPEAEVEALARGRVYTGKDALAAGLVDGVGGIVAAVAEVRKSLPKVVRDRIEPRLIRLPRRSVPLPEAPKEGEAGRRAARALLGSLLPDGERALLELASTGERVLALFTGFARFR